MSRATRVPKPSAGNHGASKRVAKRGPEPARSLAHTAGPGGSTARQTFSASQVTYLQSAIGNRAVTQLLAGPPRGAAGSAGGVESKGGLPAPLRAGLESL